MDEEDVLDEEVVVGGTWPNTLAPALGCWPNTEGEEELPNAAGRRRVKQVNRNSRGTWRRGLSLRTSHLVGLILSRIPLVEVGERMKIHTKNY